MHKGKENSHKKVYQLCTIMLNVALADGVE